ncbi:hypothetical protein DH2020_046469 [Rehmannia glutinosa]|uniref:Uncharacterized protein n=1 Tax=Rehmannia glutinosa TaxID=99300 RepID=A0ABR0UCX8_REHGL
MAAVPSNWPKDVRPPILSYSQSMFDDTFTSLSLDLQEQENYVELIETLKVEARSMLMAKGNTIRDKLVLIDTLERLGVAYHFDQDIEEQLEEIIKFQFEDEDQDYDLFIVALQFRLFRQHHHHVSCSIFDKFKGEDNKFIETIHTDAKGLLSLYEATHLRIHGEQVLEDALTFTKHHLNRMVQQLEPPLQDQVKRALEQPLHREYVQKDLCLLSRWWNEVSPSLSYARNRVVEAYLWGTAYHFEPQYSYVRVAVAKSIQMLTVVDDTYDNYATLEETDLFTKILERWNIDEIDQLPDYMQILYNFILRIYDDYEREAAEEGKLFIVPYAKETLKEICKAYNKGLKWFMGQQIPSFEEYIVNSEITSCIYVISSWTIMGMKSAVSKEIIDWLMSQPKIIIASAKVCRHLDDLSSFERESRQGQILTGVDLYMKQHGVSMQETADKFVELIEEAWKDLNTEWMSKTSIPKDLVEQVLGYARAAEVFHRSADFTHSLGFDLLSRASMAGVWVMLVGETDLYGIALDLFLAASLPTIPGLPCPPFSLILISLPFRPILIAMLYVVILPRMRFMRLNSINPEGVAWPDGFNALFFQKCWNIVQDDVVAAIHEFFDGHPLTKAFTSTTIVLIPKIAQPHTWAILGL